MFFNQHGSAVGIFSSRQEAAQALDQIVFSGFPIAKAFLVSEDWIDPKGQDATWMREIIDKARAGAVTGTPPELKKGLGVGLILGGAIGLLWGFSILALPGIGPAVLEAVIAFILLHGGIYAAVGGVIGSLVGLGLSTQQAKEVARRVSKGEVLLVVKGTEAEVTSAERLLTDDVLS